MTRHKQGWFRTWPDAAEDGVLWRGGLKFGRVHRYKDGRWWWATWCCNGPNGLLDSKDEAKAAVERWADATATTHSCYPCTPLRRARGVPMIRLATGLALVALSIDPARAMALCDDAERYTCVIDGDTLWIEGEKLRLQDIDAPEIDARCDKELRLAVEAAERLAALLGAGGFSVVRDGTDRFDRTLATVSIDGRSVGQLLVDEGLARQWTGRRGPWC